MAEARLVTTLLADQFKLSSKHCPQSPEKEEEMSRVPYASTVGLLMYAIVCTRPYLTNAVSTISQFMSRKATLRSSEVDDTISARNCETRLGVSKNENGKV